MRHPIEESPRDGTAIIIEDDASGTYDVAHWSTETGKWVGENGEPTKVTPTHWHPVPRDQYSLREDAKMRIQSRGVRARRLAASSIAVTLFATALIVTYFRAEVAAYVTQYAVHEDRYVTEQVERELTKSAALLQEAKAAQAMTANAEPRRGALEEAKVHDDRYITEQVERELTKGAALLQEAKAAQAMTANAEPQRRALEEAKVHDDKYITEQVERELTKSAALLQEAKAAQAMTANAEPQRRALEEAQARAAALASELAGKSREIETQAAQSQKAVDAATKQKQATESIVAELRQSLEQEQKKTTALLQEAKAAQAMTANAEPQRRALEEAQARAAALASELAGKSREIETQAAQSQKAVDAATKQKQATESIVAELRQSLEQEQKKTTALLQEAKAAQAMTANAEPQRRVLEEAQARAAALASELDGATNQKQAAEANAAELQKSLQQELDRTEAMGSATVRRTMDGRVPVGPSANNSVTQVTQKVKTAAAEPPKAMEAQGTAEAAKLIERASGLLGQGNIGAARIVLERAAESGNARASFMLAETYDPVILSAWGTYGTRGEAAKAREHYAKAHAGGIQEAKGRLDAMRQ